jgi:hypothetical protein
MRNPLIYNETGVSTVSKFLVGDGIPTYPPGENGSVVSYRRSFFSYPGDPGFIGYQWVIPWFFFLLTLVLLVIKGLQLH